MKRRRRQQMLRSISTRVSQGHRRARRRRPRAPIGRNQQRNDARVRDEQKGAKAPRDPRCDDRSDLDVPEHQRLVHEEQEADEANGSTRPKRPAGERPNGTRAARTQRSPVAESTRQRAKAIRKIGMAPPTRERSEKNEASTVAAEPGAATTDRSRTRGHHRGERAVRDRQFAPRRRRDTAAPRRGRSTSRLQKPAGTPQRNAPDTRKILMTRLT